MDCEVLVVGAGPVGLTLAALLRAAGVKVVCLEREPTPRRLPRAVVLDDEALRVLQAVGVRPRGVVHDRVLLRLADGRALTLQRTSRRTAGGQPALLSLHQPDLDAALERVAGEVEWGIEVSGLETTDAGVRARVRGPHGPTDTVDARWVVGCDGARSSVRRTAGITMHGSTFAEPWTVVDGRPHGAVAASEHVEFIGDPHCPAVTLPLGGGLRRWEFLGDRLAEVPAILGRWCAEVEIVRAAVYTFHARLADRWRAGRVLLAGDAAHLMPPFAGQGLGSGLRDAANLSWRLVEVVAGGDDAVLDGYARERIRHVRAMTRYARLVGALVGTRRPRLAAVRDAALRGVEATPGISSWLQAGALKPRLPYDVLPQPAISGTRELDDLLGPGWGIVSRAPIGQTPMRTLVLGRDVESPELERWLEHRHALAAVVRPDRVIDTLVPS